MKNLQLDNDTGLYALLIYKEEFRQTVSHRGIVQEIQSIQCFDSYFDYQRALNNTPQHQCAITITNSMTFYKLTGRFPNFAKVYKVLEDKKYNVPNNY